MLWGTDRIDIVAAYMYLGAGSRRGNVVCVVWVANLILVGDG